MANQVLRLAAARRGCRSSNTCSRRMDREKGGGRAARAIGNRRSSKTRFGIRGAKVSILHCIGHSIRNVML